jgi:hypothetical protein
VFTPKSTECFSYREAKERLEHYCKEALKCPDQINIFIPNTHVCTIFLEVYAAINFGILLKDLSDSFYMLIDIKEHFEFSPNKKLTSDHLRELYQKLTTQSGLKDRIHFNKFLWATLYSWFVRRTDTDWFLFKTQLFKDGLYTPENMKSLFTKKGNLKNHIKQEGLRAKDLFEGVLKNNINDKTTKSTSKRGKTC